MNIPQEYIKKIEPYANQLIEAFRKEVINTLKALEKDENPDEHHADLLFMVLDYIIVQEKIHNYIVENIEKIIDNSIEEDVEKIKLDIIQERENYITKKTSKEIIKDIINVIEDDNAILETIYFSRATPFGKSLKEIPSIREILYQAKEVLDEKITEIKQLEFLN